MNHSPSISADLEVRGISEPDAPPEVGCPFCGGAEFRSLFDRPAGSQWSVVGCDECGQWFTSPRLPDEDWEKYYPEDYGPYQPHGSRSGWTRCAHEAFRRWGMKLHHRESNATIAPRWTKPVLASLFRKKSPYLHLPNGNGRLLDIGCGNGTYLARMRELGWQVTGLDRSSRAAHQARNRYDLRVLEGSISECSQQFKGEKFDLVTAWQVLEHIENPRRALVSVRELLVPGTGRFLLTVPNARSLGATVFGPDWIGWDLPRHATHFDKESLCRMLLAERLEVLHVRTIGQSGWLRHSANRQKSADSGWQTLLARKSISRIASAIALRHNAGESLLLIARIRPGTA